MSLFRLFRFSAQSIGYVSCTNVCFILVLRTCAAYLIRLDVVVKQYFPRVASTQHSTLTSAGRHHGKGAVSAGAGESIAALLLKSVSCYNQMLAELKDLVQKRLFTQVRSR